MSSELIDITHLIVPDEEELFFNEEEALEICDKDNSYGASWPEEIKIKNFFTKEGDKPRIF